MWIFGALYAIFLCSLWSVPVTEILSKKVLAVSKRKSQQKRVTRPATNDGWFGHRCLQESLQHITVRLGYIEVLCWGTFADGDQTAPGKAGARFLYQLVGRRPENTAAVRGYRAAASCHPRVSSFNELWSRPRFRGTSRKRWWMDPYIAGEVFVPESGATFHFWVHCNFAAWRMAAFVPLV
jgi:hypothetical protein